MWRPRNSRVFCNFTKSETLEYNDPELFKKIEEVHPEYYFDGHYLYHITRTGLNVERIEVAGANHFTVVDPLSDPASTMIARIAEMIKAGVS